MVYTPGSRSKLGSSISEVATWTSKASRTTQSKVKVAPSKPGVLALETEISAPSTSQALSTVKEATGLAYTVTSSLKVSVHSVPDSVTVRLMVYTPGSRSKLGSSISEVATWTSKTSRTTQSKVKVAPSKHGILT